MFKKLLRLVCSEFGHSWQYKDYTNWMKENGDSYEFKASRNCKRCQRHEYLYSSEWIASASKSPYDIEEDSLSVKQLPRFA